jgi:branched-chain amino acid transport system substrate-binding protein
VALIVQQAHELGWDKPIVGSDSWGSAETVKLCGEACYGSTSAPTMPLPAPRAPPRPSSTAIKKAYGYVPDDVAALTWDALGLVKQAIRTPAACPATSKKTAPPCAMQMAKIKTFEGITGNMTFTEEGDPIKCAVIVRSTTRASSNSMKSVCP